jgi:hypothetical protein
MPSVETVVFLLRKKASRPLSCLWRRRARRALTPLADVRHAVARLGFMATTPLRGGRLRNSLMVASEALGIIPKGCSHDTTIVLKTWQRPKGCSHDTTIVLKTWQRVTRRVGAAFCALFLKSAVHINHPRVL